jgi:hypothetical protein
MQSHDFHSTSSGAALMATLRKIFVVPAWFSLAAMLFREGTACS